jgi:hypothetical protein
MKCELVRDDWGKRWAPVQYPVKGRTYVVRCVYVSNLGRTGLWLEGIKNPNHAKTGVEYNFLASRFRPLVERKTDISVFKEILRTVTKPQPVDAETLRAFDRAMADAYPGYVPEYVGRARS